MPDKTAMKYYSENLTGWGLPADDLWNLAAERTDRQSCFEIEIENFLDAATANEGRGPYGK